jgi:hypothetical protein
MESSTMESSTMESSTIESSTIESSTIDSLKQQYIESLSKKEKKAYDIAFHHLGSSFTLEKSVGFLEWLKTRG